MQSVLYIVDRGEVKVFSSESGIDMLSNYNAIADDNVFLLFLLLAFSYRWFVQCNFYDCGPVKTTCNGFIKMAHVFG